MISYKKFNVFLFKKILDVYKSWDSQKVDNTFNFNFVLFEKVHKLFDMLGYLLIFAASSQEEYYEGVAHDLRLKDVSDTNDIQLSTFIPKNRDDLLLYFTKYPALIDDLNDALFRMINLENYEGLVILNRMERTLYFTVFETAEDDQQLDIFEYDIALFYQILKPLIKKYLKTLVALSKEPDVESGADPQDADPQDAPN
jgi:hypothetical protein